MAKRFSDTDLFKKKFVRGLQGAYKLLWIYIYHDCNHAGMWEPDFEVASLRIGFNVTEQIAKEQFGEKIVLIENGDKWFIPSFIEFQYGKLNVENRAHNSVIQILEKHGIKGLTSPLQGAKDKDKDKDMDKEKGLLGETEKLKKYPIPALSEFDNFRKLYPGTKRGNETEFTNFTKKHEDWKAVLNDLLPALNKQIAWRKEAGLTQQFVPQWANLQTWINQRKWEEEMGKKAIQSQPGRSGQQVERGNFLES